MYNGHIDAHQGDTGETAKDVGEMVRGVQPRHNGNQE